MNKVIVWGVIAKHERTIFNSVVIIANSHRNKRCVISSLTETESIGFELCNLSILPSSYLPLLVQYLPTFFT
jgi:hypothetical protein